VVLGRRGPAQAAFTSSELRELGHLDGAELRVDPEEIELDPLSQSWLESEGTFTARKNVALLREFATGSEHTDALRRIVLRFLRSPVEILGEGENGPVTGVRVAVNELREEGGRARAVATGDEEVIECGLVLRSIGYRGLPVAGISFDESRGLIRNDGGRVLGDDGHPASGEYVVGWIKRGPSGVIGTNKKDANDTVQKILADREAGALQASEPLLATAQATVAWITDRVPDHVTWAGWERIDLHETDLGEAAGRPRIKLTSVEELKLASREVSGR
jgi:ferredoxin/flavodoxin---NADP+ reductase